MKRFLLMEVLRASMPGIPAEEDKIHNSDKDEDEDSKIPNPLDIIRRDRDKSQNPNVPPA